MTVDELIKSTRAEVVANKAVARIDGERVVVAQVFRGAMVLTEAGNELASVTKPAPSRKAKAPAPQKPEVEAPAQPNLEL